ncbi:lactonase family protein [Bacteroides congonensis]|uniref:lactonase family protein n=1 Tax=Bacteroides congonensis TaxID=1871006 RepID=UPI00189B8EB0|nr:lactonase family protein [Bacteroides congonensis]
MIKFIATICIISMTTIGCTSKKAARTESSEPVNQELTMLVGTYTAGDSKGIYSFRFDEETGTATALSEAEVENPSYLVPSADGKFVYAVSEFNNEQAAANAFAFDKEKGTFKWLNSQKTGGEDPCYIITNGKNVITANYSGGSISVFPIAKDGTLLPASDIIKFEGSGADKERQEKSHLHCVRITPDGKYLFADNLGTDQIHKFIIHPEADAENKESFLKEGSPAAFEVKAGSGPRHLTFAPNGNYAYLINELSGTVIAFEYKDGNLKEIQTIAADTVGAKGSGDIHISPDGKFLYASNRLKADGIAIFRIDSENGKLTKTGYQLTGVHPRNFIITPNGKYLLVACRDSNAIQVYERDADTGLLTDIQKDIKVDKPVCIKFVP